MEKSENHTSALKRRKQVVFPTDNYTTASIRRCSEEKLLLHKNPVLICTVGGRKFGRFRSYAGVKTTSESCF
jgi:hypothetical protein